MEERKADEEDLAERVQVVGDGVVLVDCNGGGRVAFGGEAAPIFL